MALNSPSKLGEGLSLTAGNCMQAQWFALVLVHGQAYSTTNTRTTSGGLPATPPLAAAPYQGLAPMVDLSNRRLGRAFPVL